MAGIIGPVGVCNLALSLLNSPSTINSIETPTVPTEAACALWYDHTRQETLREMNWNFALKRAELAASTVTPAFGYDYKYPLPNDFIRLVRVNGYSEDEIPRDRDFSFSVENGAILTGNSLTSGGTDSDGNPLALRITYIYDITDVSKFDRLFVKLLAHNLAINLAYAVTSKNTKVQSLIDNTNMVRMKAYSVNGQESPIVRKEVSSWNTRRRNSASGAYAGPVTDLDRA